MSKAKKTRQQKIIANLHRKLQTQSHDSASTLSSTRPSIYTYKASTVHASKASLQTPATLSYVRHDLLKTTIVTSVIVLSQLLLLYLLKTHIIMIPNVSF